MRQEAGAAQELGVGASERQAVGAGHELEGGGLARAVHGARVLDLKGRGKGERGVEGEGGVRGGGGIGGERGGGLSEEGHREGGTDGRMKKGRVGGRVGQRVGVEAQLISDGTMGETGRHGQFGCVAHMPWYEET